MNEIKDKLDSKIKYAKSLLETAIRNDCCIFEITRYATMIEKLIKIKKILD